MADFLGFGRLLEHAPEGEKSIPSASAGYMSFLRQIQPDLPLLLPVQLLAQLPRTGWSLKGISSSVISSLRLAVAGFLDAQGALDNVADLLHFLRRAGHGFAVGALALKALGDEDGGGEALDAAGRLDDVAGDLVDFVAGCWSLFCWCGCC